MSNYYLSLDEHEKQRYLAKLRSLGLTDNDDPFVEGADWVDEVREWPSLEFGAIYVYLIDTPGPFTREKLHAYRSLDAFNYFSNGWVQTCYHRRTAKGVCILKAKVMRSQAVTEQPHEAWVAINDKDSCVVSAHCTCMAGYVFLLILAVCVVMCSNCFELSWT